MATYLALVEIADIGYGVVFPDCPGCTAMGDTFDEAFENGVEALRDWMASRVGAGFGLPPARDAAALRADPSLAEDFAAGPLVTPVPLFLDGSRPVRANISLEADLLATIDEAARLRGLTRSGFLAAAAREKIMAGR
jgi:predicted RNase H-like HicB family nuclease